MASDAQTNWDHLRYCLRGAVWWHTVKASSAIRAANHDPWSEPEDEELEQRIQRGDSHCEGLRSMQQGMRASRESASHGC